MKNENESEEPKKVRLFVAISLPEELQKELAEMQQRFKPYARTAKWVRMDGVHLTIKFLGYVDPDRIPAIRDSLQIIAGNHAAFSIRVSGCGFFPNTRRPNVMWTGVESEKLAQLQKDVEDAMAVLGFEKEDRAFSPHLTLARFRDSHGLTPLILETEKWKDADLGAFAAQEFVLYESILHREGAEYRKLSIFSLGK